MTPSSPGFLASDIPYLAIVSHLSHASHGGAQTSFLGNSTSSAYYPVLNSRQRIYPFVWWGPEIQTRDLRKELGVRQNPLSIAWLRIATTSEGAIPPPTPGENILLPNPLSNLPNLVSHAHI